MRVLLIGPTGENGSLPPYLRVFAEALRLFGIAVDRIGAAAPPFDEATQTFWPTDRILDAAESLLRGIDLTSYDVISLHFGNLEIEQLLPMLWESRQRPPVVYHVHSLDWTLFKTQQPDSTLRAAVAGSMQTMNGFVYFGTYAQEELVRRYSVSAPSTTAWLPTTIPSGTRSLPTDRLSAALTGSPGPVGSLYGYAAPWKDPANLVAVSAYTKTASRLILAGPFWDDPSQAGMDLSAEADMGTTYGAVHLKVNAEYLGPSARQALINGSDFAVFPYRDQSTFQGSGAIADYLAHGRPVLGTHVANMSELVGDGGLIVPPSNAEALADALDRMAGDPALRQRLAKEASKRSRRFTPAHHASRCLHLYQTVIAQSPLK